MMRKRSSRWLAGGAAMLFVMASVLAAEEPTPAAVAGFDRYVGKVEAELAEQHRSAETYLAPVDRARMRNGELTIEQLSPGSGAELPGALVHDWRGTAFVPGAHGEDFVRLLKDLPAYPRVFAPEVLRAGAVASDGDRIVAELRVKQQHIITVVLDTAYDIRFSRLDSEHGSVILRSTRVQEIDAPGTRHERALSASEQHGFLWRMNLCWSYEERDGGLYFQLESVSLSRSIPTGLGWVIGPFVESVPKESLEFTLRGMQNALRK